MQMDTRRLELRAALQKLVEQVEIEANTQRCVALIASLYKEVDSIRLARLRRIRSDWTDNAVDRAMIRQVGNFSVGIRSRGLVRTISFVDEPITLEFLFKKIPMSNRQRIESVIEQVTDPAMDPDRAQILGAALVTSVLADVSGAKPISPNEALLGRATLALDDYELEQVNRIDRSGGLWARLRGGTVHVLYERAQ